MNYKEKLDKQIAEKERATYEVENAKKVLVVRKLMDYSATSIKIY